MFIMILARKILRKVGFTMSIEYSQDKVIEVIGPHIDVRRQREWEYNRERDVLSCKTRCIPSYNMINSMLESSPDRDPLERLDGTIRKPNF